MTANFDIYFSLYRFGRDCPWIDDDEQETSQGPVYHSYRYLNGYRLTVFKAQQGSLRWWAIVNGSPVGSYLSRTQAKKSCEREACCRPKDEHLG